MYYRFLSIIALLGEECNSWSAEGVRIQVISCAAALSLPESSRVSLLVALMPAHDASWRSERRDSERRDDASPLQQLLLLFLRLWRRQPCPSLRAGEGGPP